MENFPTWLFPLEITFRKFDFSRYLEFNSTVNLDNVELNSNLFVIVRKSHRL